MSIATIAVKTAIMIKHAKAARPPSFMGTRHIAVKISHAITDRVIETRFSLVLFILSNVADHARL